jgi:adenylylsulfate kinase
MRESHLRSFMKALSWRIFGTLITMMFTYTITEKISFMLYIGLFEFVSKIVLFYVHERIWGIITFGSPRTHIVQQHDKAA